MKLLSTILILLMMTLSASAQEDIKKDVVYNVASLEVKPEFPGGLQEFYKYVKSNFAVADKTLQGKVFVTFIIEKDGTLSDIKSIRDIGNGTGEEAIRVMQSSPKWIPGQIGGKIVRTLYSIPITINPKF